MLFRVRQLIEFGAQTDRRSTDREIAMEELVVAVIANVAFLVIEALVVRLIRAFASTPATAS
jgi:hypothetical protein